MKSRRRSWRFFLIGLPLVFIGSIYLVQHAPLGVWLVGLMAMSWVMDRVTTPLDEWWARRFAKEK